MSYKRSTVGLREFYFALIALFSLSWLCFGNSETRRPSNTAFASEIYRVASCSDGDTCTIFEGEKKLKVRLIGIDAPEVPHGGKQVGQPFGKEATQYLNGLVSGRTVHLKTYGLDPYQRTLAEIMVEDKNANLAMVQGGYAEVYRGKAAKGLDRDMYVRAEDDAKSKKLGIWAIENRESPYVYRQKLRAGGRREKETK